MLQYKFIYFLFHCILVHASSIETKDLVRAIPFIVDTDSIETTSSEYTQFSFSFFRSFLLLNANHSKSQRTAFDTTFYR